jgi:hypothetical protein
MLGGAVVFGTARVRERSAELVVRDRLHVRLARLGISSMDEERPRVQAQLVGQVVEVGIGWKVGGHDDTVPESAVGEYR